MPYLTCSLLQEWRHGFFTQQFFPHSPEVLAEALAPDAEVYRVKQVHGNRVLTPSEIKACQLPDEAATALPAADGIITSQPQQAVWVASADCTPALLADGETGRVAAVHAGWRGTAQRIIPEAIDRFLAEGSELKNLRIALGPAIAGEVYQVSQKTAIEVGASLCPLDAPDAMLEALQQLPDPPFLPDSQPGRIRLDVRRINALQLEQLGIAAAQIAIAPYCTYQQPEYFFSYRRTQEKKVQWSGIESRALPTMPRLLPLAKRQHSL